MARNENENEKTKNLQKNNARVDGALCRCVKDDKFNNRYNIITHFSILAASASSSPGGVGWLW